MKAAATIPPVPAVDDLPHHLAGASAMAAATVAWGCGQVIVKLVSADGLTIALWRLVFALPIAGAMLLISRRAPTRAAWRGSAIGGVLFGAHVIVNFSALQLTSVANVTFIAALQPVLVLLVAGRFLGERVTTRIVVASAVGIAGVALVVFGADASSGASLTGDILAFVNLILWTVYFLASKRVREHTPTLHYQGIVLIAATVVVVPIALGTGSSGGLEGAEWLYVILLTLLPGTIGHFLANWAHRFVAATVSSLIVLLTPVVATFGAWLLLDESVTAPQLLGGLVILISTAFVVVRAGVPEADPEI